MRFAFTLAAVAGLVLAAGCKRQDVSSYAVPKETYGAEMASMAASQPHQHETPHAHWETPKGWEEEQPSRMRVAQFSVKAPDGRAAQVALIPFQERPGTDIEPSTVNMWREELKLEPLPTNAVAGVEVQVGDVQGKLYDMVSKDPQIEEKHKRRTIAAVARREGTIWFVKMIGEDELVASQKEALTAFLKTLDFHTGSHGEQPATAEAAPSAPMKNWKKPDTWTQVAPGQMVLAAYDVGGKAKVTVTSFPGDVGGLTANVNRWRGQVGLPSASEAEIKSGLQEVDLADGSRGTLVDLKGPNLRLLALIVKRGDQTWFYRVSGEDAAVGAEKDRLIQFAATAF